MHLAGPLRCTQPQVRNLRVTPRAMTTPRLPLLLLALWLAATMGSHAGTASMRKGAAALAAGLWELAAAHFSDCLADPSLPQAEKTTAAVRLAESLIRDSKPGEALELLTKSSLADHPETSFWKAIALTRSGRHGEALALLTVRLDDPSLPHQAEALFTSANLQLALGDPERALATLGAPALHQHPLGSRAKLHQVEILIDLGRFEKARNTLPAIDTLAAEDQPWARYLDGRLLLEEQLTAEAAARFRSVLDPAAAHSTRLRNLATLALAEALERGGDSEAATNTLLTRIQQHEDSPGIGVLFDALLDLLPDNPGPTDPVLERLNQWITPAETPATSLLAAPGSDAVGAWPLDPSIHGGELLAHALYTRAAGLLRNTTTPGIRTEAHALLNRLRLEFPLHPLASRGLLMLAREAMNHGGSRTAFSILDALRQNAAAPELRGRAAFLEAASAFADGSTTEAARLFDEAAADLDREEARSARLNAAIVRLTATGTITTGSTTTPADPHLAASMELEQALATPAAADRRHAIEEFLNRHANDPRSHEARVAAAEAALAMSPPDLAFARLQTDDVTKATPPPDEAIQPRVATVRLRLADLSGDKPASITAAKDLLDRFPASPAAAEAKLILGRNLFELRSYNDARLVLEELAATDDDPARAQAAWLLAARSAALVPTSQSQQEALILFDKAITSPHPLAPLARLEKARLMIDMNRLAEATGFLREWFASLPVEDPLHLPAGFLLGEAIYAGGTAGSDALLEALAVYDKLLAQASDQPAIHHRIQYLRGRTLQQIPDESDPSGRRERQAFIAYYSVLETDTPPAEWHYFELCGFRALALLEKAGRWPAAIACARKIASFKGPRAEEAETRANQLQLKHMIWED